MKAIIIKKANRLAANVRAFVEQGLRRIVAEQKKKGVFRLRKASFKGKGLKPGVEEGSWERIRERIYHGRGA